MTVSSTPYYRWASRGDSLQAPFNACSPNLNAVKDYYRRRWGAVSLGCHNQRNVSGSNTLSSHAWGAASDDRFPNRQATIDAMGFTIANSQELGVNTIHDYQTQRMWKPGQGWVSAGIGSVGGTWIHVETTPAAFDDRRPVEDRLSGTPDEIPGDDELTPEDKAYLDKKFEEIWARVVTSQVTGQSMSMEQMIRYVDMNANMAANLSYPTTSMVNGDTMTLEQLLRYIDYNANATLNAVNPAVATAEQADQPEG